MLQAVNQAGVKRHFLESLTESEWRERKRNERFYCPVCREEVSIRLGKKKRWHFSHKAQASCPSLGRGETDAHRCGKEKLFRWLQSQDVHVGLEYWLPQSRQRPDLYVHDPSPVAIEYQCAEMPVTQIRKRTISYRDHGVRDVWVLSHARLRRCQSQLFRVRLFEWYMSQNQHDERYFVYFDPEADTFCFLRHLTPLDASSCFATFTLHPAKKISVFELCHPPPVYPSYEQDLFSYRKKRRMSPTYRYSYRAFLHYLSVHRCYTPPLEAGWPLPSQCYIQIPCDVWQTHFLFSCLLPATRDRTLTFEQACSFLTQLFATFSHPIVPYCKKSHVVAQVVHEYLQLLCAFSILSPRCPHTFVGKRAFKREWTEKEERTHIKCWHNLFANRSSVDMMKEGKKGEH